MYISGISNIISFSLRDAICSLANYSHTRMLLCRGKVAKVLGVQ